MCPLTLAREFYHFLWIIIRTHIIPPSVHRSVLATCLAVFNQFEPVSLSLLKDVINQMKPSTCPTDVVPPRLLKGIFDTIGPVVQEIINRSLTLGVVPLDFKHAVV